jgi:hypothetical protein
MSFTRQETSLPSAAEMAACLRDPSRKAKLRERIETCFYRLRSEVPRPHKDDPALVKKYGEFMARLRVEEETILEMLEAFSKGDASSVRAASSRLVRG